MTLVTSGLIRIGQTTDTDNRSIAAEFGGTPPHNLSEYYRGGGLVPDTANNAGIPVSGPIQLSDFYGAANIFQTTITVGIRSVSPNVFYGYEDPASLLSSGIGSSSNTDVFGNLLYGFTLRSSSSVINRIDLYLQGHLAAGAFSSVTFDVRTGIPVTLTESTATSRAQQEIAGASVLRTRWAWSGAVLSGLPNHNWIATQSQLVTIEP